MSLLDSLQTPENKKMVLRLITLVAENTENKLEIGRLEGFAKMLKLLLDEDKELTREILKTLKHFLDVQSMQLSQDNSIAQSILNNNNVTNPAQLTSAIAGSISEDTKKSYASLAELFPERLRNVASDVTRVLVSELHRVFSQKAVEGGSGNLEEDSEEEENFHRDVNFIPTALQVQEAFNQGKKQGIRCILLLNQIAIPTVTNNNSETTEPHRLNVELTNIPSVPHSVNSIPEDEILQELMRVQGALTALTSTLQEAALNEQLDLIDTISRVIFKNQLNQHEFKKIDGYSFFTKIFDRISLDSPSKQSALFLQDCFNILFIITLDGNKNKRVGNLDSLEFMLRIMTSSSHKDIQNQSVLCIQDILAINPLNAVDFYYAKGIDFIFDMVLLGGKHLWENEVHTLSILHILNYVALVLSNYNMEILEKYLQYISPSSALPTPAKILMANSLYYLLCDLSYHNIKPPAHTVTALINVLRYGFCNQR